MKLEGYAFGSITIDGQEYHGDIVIDRGEVRKRKKSPSRKYRDQYGHTPLSLEEDIPWDCRRLVVGIGAMGAMPVLDEVKEEAEKRHVKLELLRTGDAVERLRAKPAHTNAILHVTC